LSGDIEGDLELRLDFLLDVSVATDQVAMFLGWYIDHFTCLAIKLGNYLFDC
jgi:hypothetical protein